MNNKAYLSITSLCDYLDCSKTWIKDKVRDGTFQLGVHYVQPDGPNTKYKFIRSEIDKWMQRDASLESKSLAQIMAEKLIAS